MFPAQLTSLPIPRSLIVRLSCPGARRPAVPLRAAKCAAPDEEEGQYLGAAPPVPPGRGCHRTGRGGRGGGTPGRGPGGGRGKAGGNARSGWGRAGQAGGPDFEVALLGEAGG